MKGVQALVLVQAVAAQVVDLVLCQLEVPVVPVKLASPEAAAALQPVLDFAPRDAQFVHFARITYHAASLAVAADAGRAESSRAKVAILRAAFRLAFRLHSAVLGAICLANNVI